MIVLEKNGSTVEYKTKGGTFAGTDRYGTEKDILTVITSK